MQTGKLIEMGQLSTVDDDGTKTQYKFALVIEFNSPDEIRKAISEGQCKFEFGTQQPT